MRRTIIVLLIVIAAYVGAVVLKQGIRADVLTTTQLGQSHFKVLIQDEVGIAIDDATLTITNQETNKSVIIAQKDNLGYYVRRMPAGAYTIQADAAGFESDVQHTIIAKGETQEIVFNLVEKP
jgi:hypothetical protein